MQVFNHIFFSVQISFVFIFKTIKDFENGLPNFVIPLLLYILKFYLKFCLLENEIKQNE